MAWHVLRKNENEWVKKCRDYEVHGVRPRDRPKKIWSEVTEKDCQTPQLCKNDDMNHRNKTTQQQQLFYNSLSGTTRVSRYQKKHSPTHHPDHPIFISLFHLPWSITSCLFKLRAWQSFSTTSLHVLFGLPLSLEPSTSYSIHFFTQSVSSFRNKRPYHRNLFCCSINITPCFKRMSHIWLAITLTHMNGFWYFLAKMLPIK